MSSQKVTVAFTGTGVSAAVTANGKLNILIEGGAGVVEVERALDGTNFFVVSKDSSGSAAVYTTVADSVAFNGTVDEREANVKYRLNCTTHTSGTVNGRISGSGSIS